MKEEEIIKQLVNLALKETRDEFKGTEIINKIQTKAKQYFIKIVK